MTPQDPHRFTHLVVADAGVLRIRYKHIDDAIEDYAWRRDVALTRFDGNPPLEASFSEFIEQARRDIQFVTGERRAFSLEAPDGTHFGNVMYYNADLARTSAEVGITIALPEYRDRGLGSLAMITFLRYLWHSQTFHHLYLHTLAWNERAQRCFQHAGFDQGRRITRNGEELVRMSARREWWLMWQQEGRFEAPLRRAMERAQRRAPSASGEATALP